jgi:hypothetical protein
MPIPFGAALGQAAGAAAGGQDEASERMIKAMQVAEQVRQSRQEREILQKYGLPMAQRIAAGLGVPVQTVLQHMPDAAPGAAGAPAAAPPGSNAPPPPAAPSEMPGGFTPGSFGVPSQNLSRYGLPARPMPEAAPALPPGPQNTGLLLPPDDTQTASLDTGLLNPASYGGQAPRAPPFRLAATTLGAGGAAAAGDDVLDRVVAPLESGNRNIMQQVNNTSTANGYYQITNSTWRDVAPKAGVDVDKYPTAMSAPRDIQKQVAQELYQQRGIQPWADFNPAVARAVGYAGASQRGEKPADIVLPSDGGGSDALTGLLKLVSAPGSGGLDMPFPTIQDPNKPASAWQQGFTYDAPKVPFGQDPGDILPGVVLPPKSGPRGLPASALQRVADTGGGGPLATPPGAGAALATPSGTIPGTNVTAQQLAALNAILKMGGMKSDVFGSLLEGYYKSPEYITQSAAAAELGKLPFEGPKAAAVAKAQQKYIQENQAHQSDLDIAKELLTKGGLVQMSDGSYKQIKTITDALAAVDIAKQADAASREIVTVTVTPPGANRPQEMQMTKAQAKDVVEGRGVPALGIPAMSGAKVGKPVFLPGEAALGPVEAKDIFEKYQAATDAAMTIETNKEARALLDAGVFTGTGADRVTALAKIGNALKLNGKTTQETVANTEAYLATTAGNVGRMIKQFGSGTGLSDADREYAAQMAAGKTTLDEISIRRILDINDRASMNIINRHNQRVSKIAPGATMTDLNVPVPTPYERKGAPPEQHGALRSEAQAAIAKGAPREAVIQRLQSLGVDVGGL